MALSVVSFVIDKLKDPVLEEASLLYGVSSKVNSVKRKLEYINAALEAAEKDGNDDVREKVWVDQLREVAFRIEDAIDIYHIEVKVDGTSATHGSCHPSNFIKWVQKNVTRLAARHNLGVELSGIDATLKEIKENSEMFKPDQSDPSRSSHPQEKSVKSRHQFEFLDESQIVGLEDDKKTIVKKLLDAKVRDVITIVGTAGIGKTTLARKIFNSKEAKENFSKRIWLPISREFDRVGILKKMLEEIRKDKQEDRNEEYFIREIRNSLKNQRFLIVLDDVWDQEFWPAIKDVCPPDDEMGRGRGRVLITTRDKKVADKAHSQPHIPPFLNLEDSKMLLYKCAFPEQEHPRNLDDVATEIAKKCHGLPLALIVVGGQLYDKYKHSEWRKVAYSMNWHEGEGGKCMEVLKTSYDDMPIILRTCFMYLASFPEDRLIDAKPLFRTWVGENFVPDEEAAENCLQQLAQRCLIIVCETSNDGSIKTFLVHDVVLELAISKAKENKFMWVIKPKANEQVLGFNIDARRASLHYHSRISLKSNSQNYNKKLRSLHLYDESANAGLGRLPKDIDWSGFRLLTVLTVENCDWIARAFKKWSEELILLRYIGLRRCIFDNDDIPECIGRFKNLVTLECIIVGSLTVPESVWSITTLRHLLIHPWGYIYAQKQKQVAMPNLEILRGPMLKLEPSIYHFPKIRQLCIQDTGPWVAENLLKNLSNNLVKLSIFPTNSTTLWGKNPSLSDVVFDMKVFPFYQNLQCLKLKGEWPEHIALRVHHFPPNLIRLSIASCTFKEDPMPELEKLEYLEMLMLSYSCTEAVTRLTCSAGGFPRLHKLRIKGFSTVAEFSIAPEAMPIIKELEVQEFQGLRNNIPELHHLKMLRRFKWTDAGFPNDEEADKWREQNQHKLGHIPTVTVD